MKKSNFECTFFARTRPWTVIGRMIFWFVFVRDEAGLAQCKSVTKQQTATIYNVHRHGLSTKNKQGTDTMRGFEPRSRQHDTSVCSPLHHIGKTVAVKPKKVPYLVSLGRGSSKTQRYTMSIVVGSRHLYFTTRGLVDTFCCAFFVELHVPCFPSMDYCSQSRWTELVLRVFH